MMFAQTNEGTAMLAMVLHNPRRYEQQRMVRSPTWSILTSNRCQNQQRGLYKHPSESQMSGKRTRRTSRMG